MTNLTVFNNDIIPVYTTDAGDKVVIGRELHERLRISSRYADWFKNMCGYGFSEGTDFSAYSKNLENGGRSIEHILTLDMAKHIAMIQRTPQGATAKTYDHSSAFTPLLQHILQDFASVRAIQRIKKQRTQKGRSKC